MPAPFPEERRVMAECALLNAASRAARRAISPPIAIAIDAAALVAISARLSRSNEMAPPPAPGPRRDAGGTGSAGSVSRGSRALRPPKESSRWKCHRERRRCREHPRPVRGSLLEEGARGAVEV